MRDSELTVKVQSSIGRQCHTRGYAAPVDVLMDVGVLDKRKYEDWRTGHIPYLESVCTCNLRQLSLMMELDTGADTDSGESDVVIGKEHFNHG